MTFKVICKMEVPDGYARNFRRPEKLVLLNNAAVFSYLSVYDETLGIPPDPQRFYHKTNGVYAGTIRPVAGILPAYGKKNNEPIVLKKL